MCCSIYIYITETPKPKSKLNSVSIRPPWSFVVVSALTDISWTRAQPYFDLSSTFSFV